jgi:ABC-2 type transport system permease protein
MKNALLVLRNEIITTVGRKSFLFGAFGLPLIAVLIYLGVAVLKGGASQAVSDSDEALDASELRVEGYVDHGGLIKAVFSDIPEGILISYPDEASARQALDAGEIAAYYLVPADYVERGDLIYVNPDYSLVSPRDQSWVMQRTIFANLLANDAERIARAWRPMNVQVKALASPKAQPDKDDPMTFYVPYGTMMVFYIVILMSASLLLNSVSEEKKNQVVEILLSSVSSRQLLTGKILALGILGLLQAVIWLGTGYALLHIGGQTLSLPSGFDLPFSVLAWAIVFFLLGYAVYASLMAGLGALAPNLQAASQAVFVVIWPLIIPLFFFVSLIEDTYGALATGLSLFPLTAPVAMVTRLVVGDVPLWQPALATVLLVIAAALIIRAVAAMFHAQTLLSGQPFSARRYLRALLGRA